MIVLILLTAACSDAAPSSTSPSASTVPAGTSASTGPVTASGSADPEPVNSVLVPPIDTQTPSVAISAAPAVSLGTTTKLADGVKVLVSKVSAVRVEASGPGDIAGDGIAVHLTVKNSSGKAFDLNGLAVTASYGPGRPASPGGASTGDPLTGSLKTADSARGVYVFTVPKAQVPSVEVQISSNASPIIVVYTNR
jgi:hypothetical protein